jgi:hypothetical protein
VWNTFQTRALCLNCGKKWHVTQCLECHQYSPHEDWYHDKDLDKQREKERERERTRERIRTR